MIEGKTSTGFEFTISDDIKNDYELIEQLSEFEDNPLMLTKVVNSILGKDQAKNLKEHVRDENGIVPTDIMVKEVVEIFNGGEIKNS